MINKDVKKVLVIGSGPIVIGQAAEFDYAGTQACRSLREEGVEVVLVNSNPSTIMTDVDIADRVYIEPITLPFVTEVIKKERPDALLATLGGQVGLNMAVQLSDAGVLDQYGVKLLGSSLHAIKHAEDRELFKAAMEEIHQPVPESEIFEELEPAIAFADKIGYPVIIRPAYTLGGTGGGIAHDRYEMEEIANRGIKLSPINQILVERSIAGWKEVEFEVMRDSADNCIIVCAMENIDPVGVHTGDSIVVAPTQTLTDGQYQMLRTASLDIIRYLKIEGGCNVQYGLDTKTNQYYVIEVNPRVSRSSALASKATGYPIAKVAAKIALGLHLDEITNAITGNTKACFEPSIDYVVCKFPRWPFEKFTLADRAIGTQMKATGEVMALDRTLEGSLLKADAFKPALEFLQLNSGQSASADETPVFKFNTKGGGNTFAVQVLIYGDGGFELSLADVTRAEKSRKLKQQMSNNITHELRTPVSSIRGYIETILDCDSLSDERKHYFLEKAQAQVVRLSDLIRDVALITKTEEAADLMPREQVDMARVVADAQEDLHEMFDRTATRATPQGKLSI